jgi:hypothetical protein
MLDRLGGSKSARLPELLDGIQPVVIYSDLSGSIVSELFEPRALTSFQASGIFGRWGGIELKADSPGGLLVERVTCRNTGDNEGVTLAVNGFSIFTAGAITEATHLDVGGTPTVSRALYNIEIAALPANGVQIRLPQSVTFDLPVERIYVPPGFTFLLAQTSLGVTVDATLVWRELVDAQGSQ